MQPFFESKIGCQYKYLFTPHLILVFCFKLRFFSKKIWACSSVHCYSVSCYQITNIIIIMNSQDKCIHCKYTTFQLSNSGVMWKNHLGPSTQIRLKSQFYYSRRTKVCYGIRFSLIRNILLNIFWGWISEFWKQFWPYFIYN